MSFDEIKLAVLALPESQRVQLSGVIADSLAGEYKMSPNQEADLREAMAEAAADPEGGEDAFEAIARVRAGLQKTRMATPAARP